MTNVIVIHVQKNLCTTATKIDKTKILMTNGSLIKVESIADCNTFDLH